MIINAFLALIMPNIEVIIFAIIAAVMSIAALLAALIIFKDGASKVLNFIEGGSPGAPKVGYQYEEWVGGRKQYRTWTKKDQYFYDKNRR